MRIATYGLTVGEEARAYVAAHLCHRPLRQWRATGMAQRYDPMPHRFNLPHAPWPGPAPRPARALEVGTPENATCPYSGAPAVSLMTTDGRIFGFCNDGCRDKTVADPDAWPAFRRLLGASPPAAATAGRAPAPA